MMRNNGGNTNQPWVIVSLQGKGRLNNIPESYTNYAMHVRSL
ncbi:Uncharacterised protein [Serratia fonticola]|nr:Uncharacterised protein [Serratia fonticola]